MAVVTAAPILIDPIGFSRQSNSEINPMFFPLAISNLYNGLARNIAVSPQFTNSVNAFKSIDTAANWVLENSTGSPGRDDSFFSYRNGIIRCAVQTHGNTLEYKVKPFDTATNLWGTISPALTLSDAPNTPSGGHCAQIIDKPNGDVVFLFCAPATSTQLKYAILSAGTWGSVTDILAVADNSYITGAIVDPATGAIFVTYGTGYIDEYFCVRLDNSFSPGTPQDLGNFGDTLRTDIKLFGLDSIAISYGSNGDSSAHVAIGTPRSAPAFTDYLVGPITGSGYNLYTTLAIDLTGKLNCFYGYQDYGVPSPYVDEVRQTTFDGISTWSSPILFYDAVTNPPANNVAPVDQFIHTMQAANQFASGTWIVYIGMEVIITSGDDPGGEACAGFMLVSGDVPLTVTCPVGGGTGTLGAAYNKTLVGSGGTGILTYQLLSGSLPAGLTFNPATGNISGTIMGAGTYSPVYTVTDSLGNISDPVTCPIVIAGSNRPARKCVPQT